MERRASSDEAPGAGQTRERIERIAAAFSGQIGLAAAALEEGPEGAEHLAGGREDRPPEPLARLADEPFPAASVIKLPILVTIFRLADEGRLPLNGRVILRRADQVIGSGVLKEMQPGLAVSLLELATLMIVVSDNTATNMLIDRIGVETVNATSAELGLSPSTRLIGKLCVPPELRNGEQRRGAFATTTPSDMLRLLTLIYRGEAASPESCQAMIGILKRQQYTEILGRYLPFDPDSVEEGEPGTVVIASKSGSIRGVRNDVGIVYGPRRTYAVALMSKGCADLRFHPENEGIVALARISRVIYDHFQARSHFHA